jgi:hypothetical protein
MIRVDADTLLTYPYVVVRLACRYCARVGAYRLVRLAVKFGCEARLSEVVIRLAADCPHWRANKRWPEGCGVYLPDLEAPRLVPDDPRQRVMRVIDGGKSKARGNKRNDGGKNGGGKSEEPDR